MRKLILAAATLASAAALIANVQPAAAAAENVYVLVPVGAGGIPEAVTTVDKLIYISKAQTQTGSIPTGCNQGQGTTVGWVQNIIAMKATGGASRIQRIITVGSIAEKAGERIGGDPNTGGGLVEQFPPVGQTCQIDGTEYRRFQGIRL